MKRKKLSMIFLSAILAFGMNDSIVGKISREPVKVQAETKKSAKQQKQAIKKYKNILKKRVLSLSELADDCDLTTARFAVMDLNHDSVPELILDTMEQYGEATSALVLTYYHGNISLAATCSHGYPEYFSKGNVFTTCYSNRGYGDTIVYEIQKGKGVPVAEVTSDLAAGLENPKGVQYYISGKEVTKKKYNAFLKKRTKATASTSNSLNYYEVTSSNVDMYVK
jgi:hypothetical protein